MSTGFKNNNYGNINYINGTNWEGSTGLTTITADGQKNIIFVNPIYGIRALMVIIRTKIGRNLTNTFDILRSYSPGQSEKELIQRANYINKKYFNNAPPQDDVLDLGDESIIGLTKGIIETEIPEANQVPDKYYEVALKYFNNGDDQEAATYTNQIKTSTFAGINIWLILAIVGAGLYMINKKKK